MKKGRVLILVLVLFPIISFAADYDKPKTGYDLYQDLMGLDPNNSAQQRINALYSVGYLDGFLDSLRFMEDMYYESFFPSKTLS